MRDHVPVGASIAIEAEGDADIVYLLALGQLPRQRVEKADALETIASLANPVEYVAVLGHRWRHPGYRPVTRLNGGWLYLRAKT